MATTDGPADEAARSKSEVQAGSCTRNFRRVDSATIGGSREAETVVQIAADEVDCFCETESAIRNYAAGVRRRPLVIPRIDTCLE